MIAKLENTLSYVKQNMDQTQNLYIQAQRQQK